MWADSLIKTGESLTEVEPDGSPAWADICLKCSHCSPRWTEVFVPASLPQCSWVPNFTFMFTLSRLFCKVGQRTEKPGTPIRERQENRFTFFYCYDYSAVEVEVEACSCSSLNGHFLGFHRKRWPTYGSGLSSGVPLLESRSLQDCPGCWPRVCRTGRKSTTKTSKLKDKKTRERKWDGTCKLGQSKT